jgi:hypothetical protein
MHHSTEPQRGETRKPGAEREVKHSPSPLVNIKKGFEALKERNIERP